MAGKAYNRQDLMTSMRTTIQNGSESAGEGDKKSAGDATTAEGKASEEKETPAGGSEGGDEGADENEGGAASGSPSQQWIPFCVVGRNSRPCSLPARPCSRRIRLGPRSSPHPP